MGLDLKTRWVAVKSLSRSVGDGLVWGKWYATQATDDRLGPRQNGGGLWGAEGML